MGTKRSDANRDLTTLMQRLLGFVNAGNSAASLRVQQESGLSTSQSIVLHVIDAEGPRTISELAEQTNLTVGATSQLVDRMIEQQWVARNESPRDRRIRYVSLLPNGQAVLTKLHGLRKREWTQVLDRLPKATRAKMHAVMADVMEVLEADEKQPESSDDD